MSRNPGEVSPSQAAAPAAGGYRILVADDNVDAATSLQLLLQAMGHQVALAHDGNSAVDLARRTRPQFLFLDIAMPGLDGYEVARRLRQEFDRGDLRIYAMTGFGADADRQRSLDAGIDQHLVKPVDPAFLESLLGRR